MRTRSVFLAFAAAIVAGCAASTPTVDTTDESRMTFDGLYPVKGTRADEAWARPGVDLSQYSKVMMRSVGVEYRPGGESGRTAMSRSRGGPYEVSESQKAAFASIMAEAFLKELEKSDHFTIVSEPGPDVLLIRGALLDVVSYVPPETIGGRDAVYLTRVGEATLVLELRDSITETIFARAVDRRAAEDAIGFQESTRINNAAEIRRLAQTWARMLRTRLDEFAQPAG